MSDQNEITVRVVRSKRKTIGLHITKDGNAEVRAPYYATKGEIESFIRENTEWIRKHAAQARERAQIAEQTPKLSQTELNHPCVLREKYLQSELPTMHRYSESVIIKSPSASSAPAGEAVQRTET